MKVLTIIVRVLLGLVFVFFGSNLLFNFLPTPPPPPGLAGDFSKVFVASGWIHAVGLFQLVGGLLVLIGRFVPLGLTLLGPVIVNILLFHGLMDPSDIVPGIVVAVLWLFLISRYWANFAGIFQP